MRTRHAALLALAGALSTGACSDGTPDRSAKDVLATDTSLAADLKLATDTSAYADAADVAMADPAPAGSAGSIAVPPVTMRVNEGSRSAAGTEAPATPPPATPGARVATPAQAPPAAVSPPAARTTVPPPLDTRTTPSAGAPRAGTVVEGPPSEGCASPARDDQRRCLMSQLARSDVELDRNYQRLIGLLRRQAGTPTGAREPATVQQLRVAQRAWLVYRDTECRQRNRGQEGPLWAPIRARCLGEFSGRRAAELAEAASRIERRS